MSEPALLPHAMIGGMSGVENDVIPYGSVMGERANLAGLNLIGLKRRGFNRDTIHGLRNAYKALFNRSENSLDDRVKKARQDFAENQEVMQMLDFIMHESKRALCTPYHG